MLEHIRLSKAKHSTLFGKLLAERIIWQSLSSTPTVGFRETYIPMLPLLFVIFYLMMQQGFCLSVWNKFWGDEQAPRGGGCA